MMGEIPRYSEFDRKWWENTIATKATIMSSASAPIAHVYRPEVAYNSIFKLCKLLWKLNILKL
jgi:hypothetical protein